MSPATRHQPRRAVRDKPPSAIQSPVTPGKTLASRAGIQKTTSKNKTTQEKRGRRATKGAQAKAIKALENRVSAMGTEVALSEQRELLGIAGDPNHISPVLSKATPKVSKSKRGRKKKPAEEMYMDDFLLSDEGETGEFPGKEAGGRVRRDDRWIPDMEHRGRLARKPKNVPYQIWMSYNLLDDYIYRQSLTDEEALKHPLLDDVYTFQTGGPKPATPAGFQWNDRRRLVPIKENAMPKATEEI
ncbi:hypothetical protein F5Y06DRAFT_285457 [Hypoxylon sp. FL0890]|nr:hypothetical protein F5Y06DRAFT_285457 [Hypoxylon sp. FL0890]